MGKRSISIILVLLLVFITIPLNISYAETGTNLVFELGKGSYTAKEEIKGTGTIIKGDVPAAGVYVALTVEDKTGLSLFKVGQYTTDSNGKFNVNFKLPNSMESGKYLLKVKTLEKEIIKDLEYLSTVTDNSGESEKPNKPKTVDKTLDEKKEKIEIKLDSNVDSFVIDPNIIKSIVDNKKNLEISLQGFKLKMQYDIFEKYKEYPIKLKLELENKERGGDYTQVFPSVKFELNAIIGDKVEQLKLNKKITISINYSDKSGLNYEKACFYRVEENGNLVFLGGKLNKDTKTIECEIDRFGQYEVLIYNRTFNDIDIAWARNPIEVLAARHIINGVDKDNFMPNNNITRAEFCKMLISTLDVELIDNHTEFSDVDKNKWYYDYINSAARLGLVEGYNGMFKPDDYITREAMVVMISRAAKLEKYGQSNLTGNLNFTDSNSISDWSRDAVMFAKENEIIKGAGSNNFEPKRNATRAEVAVIIYKTLKLKGAI